MCLRVKGRQTNTSIKFDYTVTTQDITYFKGSAQSFRFIINRRVYTTRGNPNCHIRQIQIDGNTKSNKTPGKQKIRNSVRLTLSSIGMMCFSIVCGVMVHKTLATVGNSLGEINSWSFNTLGRSEIVMASATK